MMKGRCNGLAIVGALMLGLFGAGLARGADEPKIAAGTQPTTRRSPQEIMETMNATGAELGKLITGPEVFTDAKKRAEIGPKVIPLVRKMLNSFNELAAVEPMAAKQGGRVRIQFLSVLSVMGDAEADGELNKLAQSADAKEKLTACASQLMVRWWKTDGKADEQTKVLDEFQKLAQANATEDSLVGILMVMSQNGAANDEQRKRVESIIAKDLKGEAAKQVAQQLEASGKLRAMEGKPLVIEGLTVDGKKFSTADWKGKVVLVDFWATWCGPCMREMPKVKKLYKDYHAKGLEIVGVSCDRSEEALKKFMEKETEVAWPQLFDKDKPGWHALATSFGIDGIPTMFLIDKKGVVRTVEAREKFEELVPKMLEEKAE